MRKHSSEWKRLRSATAAMVAVVFMGLVVGCPMLRPPAAGCTADADCDDGNACTMDACNPAGVCVNDPIACASPGPAGPRGADGLGVKTTDRHGTDMLLSTGEFEEAGKFFATATITSANADADGTVTVDFTVEDAEGEPVTGVTGVDFTIVTLAPASGDESFNKWVPYMFRTETVEGSADGDWPNPDGTTAFQAYRESGGTFTDNDDGSYSYVFETNLANATMDGTPIPYDRSLTHRVSIMIGGHSGPTADANYDFVPDGSAVTETRNIVETATCKNCHGVEFAGHGGDRLTVENCVTCHLPGSLDAQSGETVDMAPMIHKIHAGGELASIPGPDGIVWDDPATPEDESADNGEYAIWGNRNNKHTWWKVGFPAVLSNCMSCHQGSGEDMDNWKNVPSRTACDSCHDDVDFATGTNHAAGPQANDNLCAACHPASGTDDAVTEAHDWTTKDPRNIPEFDVNLTVSTPANGEYFVAGESPVISIALTDVETGELIDHTTVVQDDDAEGCPEGGPCPPADGKFRNANLFVQGPRAKRNPVLSTLARVEILSETTGPWDISAADATLDLVVDGGKDLFVMDAGSGSEVLPATISVAVADGTFADTSAATAAEIVDWLNADTASVYEGEWDDAFSARAIAYLEGGKVAIRSRNLGDFYSLQLQASEVTTAVFAGNTDVQVVGGSTPSNRIYQWTNPADNDPKAAWATGAITYTLDPVDDLAPGTYVASVEMADRGRVSMTDYQTPSVGWVTFQVGTATEQPLVADSCDKCHQGPDGEGYVLDFPRHHKPFPNDAVDGCAACHDYQNRNATGEWAGGQPISRRTHAVHFGSILNYPLTTVAHEETVEGRDWDITFPQDIRHCEACHSSASSGTWATNAARIPCSGCHDSLEATAHMDIMTWDPTPLDPFSGDEEESCQACH